MHKIGWDWTAEEIEQAKQLSRELLIQLYTGGIWGFSFFVNKASRKIQLTTSTGSPATKEYFYAEATDSDIFEEYIGRCVCLCKATGTPVPQFIKNKNKEAKP